MGNVTLRMGNVGFLLGLGLVGCGAADTIDKHTSPNRPAAVTEAKSALTRSPPTAPADLLASRVGGDEAFAVELYRKLGEGELAHRNLLFSPHSISVALGMLYAGTAGTTKSEMQKVLHLEQSDADVASAYNTLEQVLASRGTNASGTKGEPFRLEAANALWGQNGQRFLDPFLDVLAQSYGAGVNLVDFARAPEQARVTINDWVSDETEQKIPELLPEGSIGPDVRFVLTNAVYFNAAWAAQFQSEATQPGTFTLVDGSTAELPLMHEGLSTRYAEGTGWKATELPYSGGEVSMLLVLPDAGTFDAFQSGFDPKKLADIDAALASATPETVALTLPRFEVRTPLSLAGALTALGMPTAFTGGADLSGIDGAHDLSIGDVIHQAYAKVDEEGTEAAAATAVIGVGSSAPTEPPPEPKHFDVRQPFLFGIRDDATGALLFLGQITDPRG